MIAFFFFEALRAAHARRRTCVRAACLAEVAFAASGRICAKHGRSRTYVFQPVTLDEETSERASERTDMAAGIILSSGMDGWMDGWSGVRLSLRHLCTRAPHQAASPNLRTLLLLSWFPLSERMSVASPARLSRLGPSDMSALHTCSSSSAPTVHGESTMLPACLDRHLHPPTQEQQHAWRMYVSHFSGDSRMSSRVSTWPTCINECMRSSGSGNGKPGAVEASERASQQASEPQNRGSSWLAGWLAPLPGPLGLLAISSCGDG
ncbi:hypothetical protein IWX49DRAFT_121944 [Phyllosticta citricarpa]